MPQFNIYSCLWLVFSLLLGLGYAFLLYRRKGSFSVESQKWLFSIRALSVSLICFLLYAPFIKLTEKTVEKPVIIFAQDNSSSLALVRPKDFDLKVYSAQIEEIRKKLSADYEVRALTIGEEVKSGSHYSFNESITDITSLFRYINDRFANRNVGAVILATDGIYNRGGNPQYQATAINAPVFTIALGDTVPKKDLLISNINYNTIAYTGNDFQVEVSIEAFLCRGKSSRLTVSDKTGRLFEKSFSINSNEFRLTLPLTLRASSKGIHRFTVKLASVGEELSTQNNTEDFFVEILDGKQKIVILANSPHPDVSALKQSIEANKNYEVKVILNAGLNITDLKDADLLILHQIPSLTVPATQLLQAAAQKPLLFILGAQSNIAAFSASQNLLQISPGGSLQEVTAGINSNFYTFVPDGKLLKEAPDLGPLLAPSGAYRIKSPASILFSQQIGHLLTDRPLLLLSDAFERKVGILAGEGIWRWRLNDFRINGSHELVDGLLSKIVQYLAGKDDKRKFRTYPSATTFGENDHVFLNAELYNDAYELINTPDVSVVIKSARNRSYPFVFSRTGNTYILDAGTLPPGEYSFTAQTEPGNNKKLYSEGKFVVIQQQAELRQTTANHHLLYTLAKQSGGEMITPRELDRLSDMVRKNELVKTISYEDRKFEDLINLKWIFFIIVSLLTIEWFSRKLDGEL